MHTRLMRKGSARVHMFKSASFVEDRGQYSLAARSSRTSYYHFEDTSVGARPLVLVGRLTEISDFLKKESRYGILNNIPGLPHIYVRTARYRAQERFRGLSAGRTLAAGAADTLKTMAGIVVDPVVANATSVIGRAGGSQSLVDAVKGALDTSMALDGARGAAKSIFGMREEQVEADARFYVEFTPLKAADATWIGTYRVNFTDRNLVSTLAKSMCGA